MNDIGPLLVGFILGVLVTFLALHYLEEYLDKNKK